MKRNLIIITILYLLLEVIYNIGLVEFLSSKNTEIQTFNMLENLGKFLSAVGITLLVLKFVKSKHLYVAAVLVPVLFMVESFGFNYLVNSLSPQNKLSAYYAGVYRNIVLNGSVPDDLLSSDSALARVTVASLRPASSQLEPVDRLLFSKVPVFQVEELYPTYEKLSQTIGPYYGVYAVESRKLEDVPKFAMGEVRRRFMEKSDGIEPGLSKQDFYKALSRKHASVKKFTSQVFIEPNPKLGIVGVTGASLPLGMSKQDLDTYMKGQIVDAFNKSKFTTKNVDNLPHSFDLISSVVVPPIALILSMASIILNASVVLWSFKKELVAVPGAFVVVSLVCSGGSLTHIERDFYVLATPVAMTMHKLFINDTNPNYQNIIVVKKSEEIDFNDLSKIAENMKSSDLPTQNLEIKVDEGKLKDKSYFGELKKKKLYQ